MELVPHKSLEGVELGASRAAIRNSLSVGFRERRNALGRLHDSFASLGLIVYYDEDGKCEAVEAASPAQPSFKGVPFVGREYSDIRMWLLNQDADLKTERAGVTSARLGLSLYIPDMKAGPSARIESVLLFADSYNSQDPEQLQKKLLKAYGLADMDEYTFVERVKLKFRRLFS